MNFNLEKRYKKIFGVPLSNKIKYTKLKFKQVKVLYQMIAKKAKLWA